MTASLCDSAGRSVRVRRGLIVAGCLAWAAGAEAQSVPLKQLTLEQLMDIDVTTAQRREEPIRLTPAAISVVTGDDLRRLGITRLADALQLADGVFSARENNSTWFIGARGLTGATPNKLLVMIDGRVIYSSIFSGMFWSVVSYVVEDLDRIEVIRGPGAALWGANAVNGVINSVTGQDLLHDQHPERPPAPGHTEFERAVRVGVALRY
ncbi:MAG TPA: Plug domain-containing protein [Vicinamibacterales bacterium]|nr:Plug domain-containing protein [Vicinamibacterales bacterium]